MNADSVRLSTETHNACFGLHHHSLLDWYRAGICDGIHPLTMDYGDVAVQHLDDIVEAFHVFEIFEELACLGEESTNRSVQ